MEQLFSYRHGMFSVLDCAVDMWLCLEPCFPESSSLHGLRQAWQEECVWCLTRGRTEVATVQWFQDSGTGTNAPKHLLALDNLHSLPRQALLSSPTLSLLDNGQQSQASPGDPEEQGQSQAPLRPPGLAALLLHWMCWFSRFPTSSDLCTVHKPGWWLLVLQFSLVGLSSSQQFQLSKGQFTWKNATSHTEELHCWLNPVKKRTMVWYYNHVWRKKRERAGHRWLTAVIPATRRLRSGGMWFEASLGK
jgi:hypothetical protein